MAPPPGRTIPPPGAGWPPACKTALPPGKSIPPGRKSVLPGGKSLLPARKTLPPRRTDPPHGRSDLPQPRSAPATASPDSNLLPAGDEEHVPRPAVHLRAPRVVHLRTVAEPVAVLVRPLRLPVVEVE